MASKKKGARTGSGQLSKRARGESNMLLRIQPAGTTADQALFKAGLKEIKRGLKQISTAIHTHKL